MSTDSNQWLSIHGGSENDPRPTLPQQPTTQRGELHDSWIDV